MICSKAEIEAFVEKFNSIETNSDTNHFAFIIGCPRSGTTILNQALVYCSDIEYVNNLTARFHWCPELGLTASQDISIPRQWVGRSNYGRTSNISEPHEFGAFWRNILGQKSMYQSESYLDLDALEYKLTRIASVVDNTFMFKVFQLIWHMAYVHNHSKLSYKWIHVKRDLMHNCMSILKLRLERGGINEWASLVPNSALECSDPYDQIVAQVMGINRWISEQAKEIDNESFLSVPYEKFCCEVVATLEHICSYLEIQFDHDKALQIKNSINSNISSTKNSDVFWMEHAANMERAIERVL